MKKVRTELVRIEKKLKAVRVEKEKVQIITDEYAAIMPELEKGLSELDKFMKKVAFESDATGAKFKSRIKPVASVLDKVLKRGKGIGSLADLVGGMILVDNKEQAKTIYDKIKKKYSSQALDFEEKTKSGDDVFGYHGTYHVDILMPGSDIVGELQIMTKKLEVYKGAAHDIYKKYRDKDDAAVRKNIPAEQGQLSRKLFTLGNKSKKLREYIEALMNGTLNEWNGNFQRGGSAGNARNARDDRKFTKQEEMEMADQSPIFRKYMTKDGWKFVCTIHAAARAFQRRLEFEFEQWKFIHDQVGAKLSAFTRWKAKDNFLLFYSRKLEQAYITEVFPDQKTVRIITVLPKGKNLVPAGTGKVLVESYGELDVISIDLEDLTEAEEKARASDAGEYLTESTLDADFISAIKINATMVQKLLANPSKTMITTDGKWVVSLNMSDITFADSSKFGKPGNAPMWVMRVPTKDLKIFDDFPIETVLKSVKKGVTLATGALTFNPYAAKSLPAYNKPFPSLAEHMVKLTISNLVGMVVNGQIAHGKINGATVTPFAAMLEIISLAYGKNSPTVLVQQDDRGPFAQVGKVELYPDYSKFKKRKGVADNAAPEGMLMSGKVPQVGDWVTGSMHYSMLSDAEAYQIVGFEGKSTVVAQEFKMKDVSKDGHTRVLSLSSEKIGQPVKLRVGRNGGIKNGSINLHLVTKNDAEVKGIKYTGSMYD